jgi:thiol-disulfide isomerase/thioredoxin
MRNASKSRVLVLLAILVALMAAWRPLTRNLEERTTLASESLDESAFAETVRKSTDQFAFLNRAWNSDKIPHREAVVRLLNQNQELQRTMPNAEQILLAGARDGDASVRELSLAALDARKHPSLPLLLANQTRDPDPNIRLLALQYAHNQPANIAFPIVGPCLEDKDLAVAAVAGAALQQLSGQDFGIHIIQVVDSKSEAATRETFEPKRAAAIAWWKAHPENHRSTPAGELPSGEPRFSVSDFALQDPAGKQFRLSDFRGKTVLLNFWATWCTSCQSEFPILNELQNRNASNLVILGIALDSASEEHESNSSHGSASTDPFARHEIQKEVARFAKDRGLKYQILLDPENSIGARFNGGELPTNVLIDSQGRFVRRFIGPREIEAFQAIVSEAAHP